MCGSNQHLKRDCTELKDQKKRANEKKRKTFGGLKPKNDEALFLVQENSPPERSNPPTLPIRTMIRSMKSAMSNRPRRNRN